MARQPIPRTTVNAALADLAAGATLAEVAARRGVGVRTLKRYRAAAAQTGSPKAAPARRRPPAGASPSPDAAEPPPSATLGALEDGDGDGDESLLDILRAELRYARAQRRGASEDAAKRGWSKRVDELVRAVERLAPPPPPPPDLLTEALRALDADAVALLEQHLPDPIGPKEIVA